MGQVYDIPYSALIATLLLKNRVVKFEEISNFDSIVSAWGCNYCTVDDIYVTNLPYNIDDFLSMFLSVGDDFFRIPDSLNYDSKIGDLTIRQILEKVASYPGDILLNYVGYKKVGNNREESIEKNKNAKSLTKVKNRFSGFCFKSA